MSDPTPAERTVRTPPQSGETLLDLSRLTLAVRRRRRMWITFSLLGMIAGGLVAVLMPPAPTAVVEVMVVHENDLPSETGTLMKTDIAVLQTTRIASEALKRIESNEDPEGFLKKYKGNGLTNNIMEIQVEGVTTAEAVRDAKALADAFIADHVSRTQKTADANAQALLDERTRNQAELAKVNSSITAAQRQADAANQDKNGDGVPDGAANGGVSAADTESLYARRAELTSKISDLTNRAETASIGAPQVKAGTQIVDPPRAVKQSALMNILMSAGIGLGVGFAAGLTLALIGGVVRDKPVLRADISTHLGASVIAQLSAPRRGLSRFWTQARALRERRRVAGTLVRLMRSGSGPVSVLELGAPRLAAALALDVAADLATDHNVVIVEDPAGRVIADDLPGRDLDGLTSRADRPIRIVGADDSTEGPVAADPSELRLGIGSIAPGAAWTDLRHLGGETLLVVRTGFANTAWLHTVARQLADSRVPIVGVVLVDPDPRDKSDGTLWDGLHTALRGRGLYPVPGPLRAIEQAPQDPPAEAATATPAPDNTAAPVRELVPERVDEPAAVTEPEPAAAPIAAPEPAAETNPVAEPVAETKPDSDEKADEKPDEKAGTATPEPQPELHPERKPNWAPEPVATTAPKPSPKPHLERKPSWVPEPVTKPTPAAPEQPVGQPAQTEAETTEHDDRTPMPVHYPAPVPANGVNGRTPNADLPTKRFAPVQPHLKNGTGDDVHDLPTKRFAPVRPDHGPKS